MELFDDKANADEENASLLDKFQHTCGEIISVWKTIASKVNIRHLVPISQCVT